MKTTSTFFRYICFMLFLGGILNGFSQAPVMKFGKVSIDELKMNKYEHDSGAAAVVLFDKGETSFNYVQGEGFRMEFTRHLRIKVFNKNGYNYADFSIPLYQNNDNREKLMSLKGKTYNLVDGKIVEDKLVDKSIYNEEKDKNHQVTKFALPDIREGSVFEISYTILSDFYFNLQSWRFQCGIPTCWSQYQVSIPEYIVYNRFARGFVPFVINEVKEEPTSVTLNFKDRNSSNYVVTTSFSSENVKFRNMIFHWACNDVPAFIEEPFMTTSGNFIESIEFELASIEFPREPIQNVTATWEKITEDLLKDKDFGAQLGKSSLVENEVKIINYTTRTPEEKMRMAYDYVKNVVKWNGITSIYVSDNLRKIINKGSGNSADVNLLLILLLRELGFIADPVVLSTRENGILHPSHPSISKLNYVIVRVKKDTTQYLLDATEPMMSFNNLPLRCMNGQGRLISNSDPQWVDLLRNEKYNTLQVAQMIISENGEIAGTVENSGTDNAASEVKNSFKKVGKENFLNGRKKKWKGWEIENVSFESMDTVNNIYKEKYTLHSSEIAQESSGMIYVNVLLNMGDKENPFKLEKREYPVDLGIPIKDTYNFAYQIPDGYSVESLPGSVNVSLPDKGGNFRFYASLESNRITIFSKLSITKTFFTPADYPVLKEFFNNVIAKYAEKIVLKKNS
jgi:Domain of Unknown Function with PDB structure (DUF3857)